MTKTSITVTLVFQTPNFKPAMEHDPEDKRPNISLVEIQKAINSQEVDLEMIDSYLTTDTPPVLIVKDRRIREEVSTHGRND